MTYLKSCFFAFVAMVSVSIPFASVFSEVARAQDSLSPPAIADVKALGEPTAKSLDEFRKAVLDQADSIARDKSLSLKDRLKARGDVIRLRITLSFKPALEKAHQIAAEQVLADGAAQSYGAINWPQLMAFLKEFIPYLLEFIKMFAGNIVPQTQFICYLDIHPVSVYDFALAA